MSKRFMIESKAQGAEMGVWEAISAAEALAAMHRDAGYDVTVQDGALVFPDAETRGMCGDLDVWYVWEYIDGSAYADERCPNCDDDRVTTTGDTEDRYDDVERCIVPHAEELCHVCDFRWLTPAVRF